MVSCLSINLNTLAVTFDDLSVLALTDAEISLVPRSSSSRLAIER